jgi:hypothetical protein
MATFGTENGFLAKIWQRLARKKESKKRVNSLIYN